MRDGDSFRAIVLVAAAALIGIGLSGCGTRGSLEPPEQAKAAGTARSAEAADAGANSAAKQKPHEGFILDGLLR